MKVIQYQNGYLVVDEIRTISYHKELSYTTSGKVMTMVSELGNPIIAQSPELSIEGIPYVELEEDLDTLSFKEFPSVEDVEQERKRNGARLIWKGGYKAAQAKKYTEEDLRKAWKSGFKYGVAEVEEFHGASENTNLNSDAYIQSLQPKIESIELETEVHKGCHCKYLEYNVIDSACAERNHCVEPVTYQKDGKTFLKVKSIKYA